MKTHALGKGRFIFFAMIVAATLLAPPALAGNSVTITGEVIPLSLIHISEPTRPY